jgi:hypothetical protein
MEDTQTHTRFSPLTEKKETEKSNVWDPVKWKSTEKGKVREEEAKVAEDLEELAVENVVINSLQKHLVRTSGCCCVSSRLR